MSLRSKVTQCREGRRKAWRRWSVAEPWFDGQAVLLASAGGRFAVTAPDDAADVLSALRLGWYLAEARGRNRPGGPGGASASLPDHADHALPLRIERTKTELRIEVQTVVAQLANALGVDEPADGGSFSKAVDSQARLLAHSRAPAAAAALYRAAELLTQPTTGQVGVGAAGTVAGGVVAAGEAALGVVARGEAALGVVAGGEAGAAAAGAAAAGAVAEAGRTAAEQAVQVLEAALVRQQRVVARLAQGAAVAERALADADGQVAAAQPRSARARSQAAAGHAVALAAVRSDEAALDGERTGADVLRQAITGLRQAIAAGRPLAARAGLGPVLTGQQVLADAADQPWQNLTELIWRFDAHIQDHLAATSETQACGYQLGRCLAETYWALDPGQVDGSAGWTFLLGSGRCTEISRLVGRLSAYMGPYTAAAIAGSVEVWKDVASMPNWRGDGSQAGQALYRQIRRWYELIILGQDPTTLIGPFSIMASYRTIGWALRLFWPQLVASLVGLAFLAALLISLSVGTGTSVQRAVSGILAAGGLSLAGLTGGLKNSAQAMVRRLRQDAYTELVAIAVQTAPPPPRKSMIHQAMGRRGLTTATPN
jgi:hypothetical protein